ncbi:hypothetical protein P152DRAFT_240933 [Eremomyces bilateralis CBS 781.70]|uniref:Carboxymuconolactone decarboxylase-like domain-containing protein n=1 Tax=Eremomyces bilateralis CBS 781.70 TaxID=1392243 RepID=A0A6G1GAC5_9PEZI|nr:uncharacterized protein P152DRAFT_240933 [Eremomyces bilateralis CBS 781.70]KAF1814983.1 hypothetical protein P152DRAFT_240933 [Eremomyces bilateralis CBS 781.70]
MGAIRTQTTSLAAAPRELAICRIAILNGADYEYGHHFPLLTDALPDTPKETLEAVLRLDAFVVPGEAELPDAKLRAVFRYTDAMTKSVAVPQEVFEGLQGLCEEREVVEVTAVVAAYNCVSRFLVALGVGDDETDK